ncbi:MULTISPECIES: FtsB family cell division protein [Pseudarthrobacter]|uniref:Cell division protein FtsB n=1 Tax=Pseudarthrobacter niigatensis TaxID=369935 RepID=A0AAJ1SUX3_9MICC|nr:MULTISPECIES: septum formation initiator family protein [Pseudarthrobacter]MDQ0146739.1 cell division protein FtsB [Pseudarthrobacter niigatensis]MDQ0264715.1 cell division protein FtsB [Pseudarthrobacter niigatensis]QDG64317.1 septum formation initiator family protein [Pseudarthrobacter sp. NIBRBAC000502771]
MATRRPKVPKVAPTRPAKETADDGSSAGAEVIRADFRPAKGSAAAAPAPSTDRHGRTTAGQRAGTAGEARSPKPSAARKGSSPVDGKDPGRADEEQHPVPAKAFSGRMLALAVVMVAITIMLAPTVKIFFDKKAEIDALNADIAARQAEGDALRQQVSRWQDPNYVKQQARDRINMVMPGETGYWVFGSDEPAGESSSPAGAAAQDPADLPWVDSLWESIRRAATD